MRGIATSCLSTLPVAHQLSFRAEKNIDRSCALLLLERIDLPGMRSRMNFALFAVAHLSSRG